MIASGLLPASKVVTRRIRLDNAVAEGFDACSTRPAQRKILIDLA
jgi:(R,R)-butanediol dehydrogenase/meso-butanediol dehydrogenase/diacetyl reductase